MKYPVVSYAGDYTVFSRIQSSLISELPKGDVEWKRSYGRKTRSVNVEVDFVEFSEEKLVKTVVPKILDHPIFHTFWTDCPDVDTYKNSVKERLQVWVQVLKQNSISDWMIVIVETPDTKKSNKLLPRTTVLDKLKNDFGGKQSERCISLIDPSKNDSRASESWQMMLNKMRQLIMIAYNRALQRFEEEMRSERERRTDKNWSFCEYFLLQEELAQIFSLLSLQEEALVQYDELDALFTQFVLNSAAGDRAKWLTNFSHPCENWEGFYLNSFQHSPMQDKIKEKNISLLEFRNYLFQKQCQILVHMKKPWELASRALTFLHNTVSELRILGVSVYEGGIACWGFLSCLEVVHLLYKYKDALNTDSHSIHTAPLWAYARDKLKELGKVCGLMPGGETTSAQLHIVVNLVCGMGEDPHVDDPVGSCSDEQTVAPCSPMTRLKEALSSKESFAKHFLDICELAISTYKHIGRIRSARHIGKDLARYYMDSYAPQKAIPFLIDQLKTFVEEDWPHLTMDTHIDLAKCYLATQDNERYVKTCVLIAASRVSKAASIQQHYFEQAISTANLLDDKNALIATDKIFEIGPLKLTSKQPIIIGSNVTVEVTITSFLPDTLQVSEMQVQLRKNAEKKEKWGPRQKRSEVERRGSNSSSGSRKLSVPNPASRSASDTSDLGDVKIIEKHDEIDFDDSKERNLYKKSLQMKFKVDRQQDTSIASASVSCSNPHQILRRRDSHGGLENFDKPVIKDDFVDYLSAKEFDLKPGKNVVVVSTEVSKKGSFNSGQIVFCCGKLEMVANRTTILTPLQFEVTHENAKMFLNRRDTELLAGVPQTLVLTVHSGSLNVEKDTKVVLKAGRGLKLKPINSEEDFSLELTINLPQIEPFNKVTFDLMAFAQLKAHNEAHITDHEVTILSGILPNKTINVDVHFVLPICVSFKLHTAHLQKFIQVTVSGVVNKKLHLSKPDLQLDSASDFSVKLLNNVDQVLVVSKGYDVNYLWQLTVEDSPTAPPLKALFTVNYQENLTDTSLRYEYAFEIHNYKSIYMLRTRVDPMKGTEFCRAGNISHLNINLEHVLKSNPQSATSVMYEVIADQHMWAVCGQSSGVLSMDTSSKQNVMTEVMPLISGFLPLPTVRLSKYIPAETKHSKENRKIDSHNVRRLQPFAPGEIYHVSRAVQVHVLPASNAVIADMSA